MNMSIKVLYLPQNFYTSPKQISGYAPACKLEEDKAFIKTLLLIKGYRPGGLGSFLGKDEKSPDLINFWQNCVKQESTSIVVIG